MPDANDKNSINRYGFHSAPVSEKAGVPPEFVHTKVVGPVEHLLQKTARAQSLKPEDADYLLAVKVLTACRVELTAPLEHAKPAAAADDTKDSVVEPATRPYGSSSF